jgi:TonB family protein
MDNQTHNTETSWVDSKLAVLVPPADWYPNSNRAYTEFQKRRDGNKRESSSSWVRLAMAAAILASIGLVVTLLPWQALWKPAAKSAEVKVQTPEPVKAPAPVAPKPAPQQTAALPQPKLAKPTLSQPALSQSALSQPAPSLPALSQPQLSGPGSGGAVLQFAQATQGPGEKPAERVGPGVTAPRGISMPQPEYTDEARQAHIQGTVTLDVIIRADGTGKVQKVIRGLGYGLDEKAVEAFERWRFQPGTKDGKPVDVQVQVVINFHLY